MLNVDEIKKQIKLIEIEKSKQWKYKRKPCLNCEYKIICAGECDRTIGGG